MRESEIDFNKYVVYENGEILSKEKGNYLSNNNKHPYVQNEFVTLSGRSTFNRHRVIWYYFRGEIPKGMQIDHIDGNKNNNSLDNLRCVSPYNNTHNENTYGNFLQAMRTKEHREKLSKALKGKKMSEDRYSKCEPTMFKEGHDVSQEIRDKIGAKNSKQIVQLDKNGNFITEWKSQTEAGKTLGINPDSISKCCIGGEFDKRRNKWTNVTQAGGFKWMFKEEYEKMLAEQPC